MERSAKALRKKLEAFLASTEMFDKNVATSQTLILFFVARRVMRFEPLDRLKDVS